MRTWIEVVGVIALAVVASMAGLWLGRRTKSWAYGAYMAGMAFVAVFALQRFIVELDFVPPFSWLATGRVRFVLAAAIIPLIFVPLLVHVPRRRFQVGLGVLVGLFVVHCSVLPFLNPAMARKTLQSLKTQVDSQGICLQQTDYTCGPAAAVTLLHRLGFRADEGSIAIWAMTSPSSGTSPDILADELRKHYGGQGLNVSLHRYRDISDLKRAGLTLAVIKCGFFVDHFVAILQVSDREIVVGDPSSGVSRYSPAEFAKVWRFSGIELSRGQPG